MPQAAGIRSSDSVPEMVAAEADDDETFFLGQDGLVDVPAAVEVGEHYGAHLGFFGVVY